MHPSSLDMHGQEGGLRWFKVLQSGRRGALYYECALMCLWCPEYYSAAPEIVKKVLDYYCAADLDDDAFQAAVKKFSLEQTYAFEKEERRVLRDRRNRAAAPTLEDASARQRKRKAREDPDDQSSDSQTDLPPHRVSRTKRQRRIVESDESSVEAVDPQPKAKTKPAKKAPKQRKPGELVPGKKHYCWPPARLRVFRDIKGLADRDLPHSALGGPQHELESVCTSSAVDLRLCAFDMSIEEQLTVSNLLFLPVITN